MSFRNAAVQTKFTTSNCFLLILSKFVIGVSNKTKKTLLNLKLITNFFINVKFSEYCEAYCQPSFYQSSYLPIIGAELNLGIEILWTGINNCTHFVINMLIFWLL